LAGSNSLLLDFRAIALRSGRSVRLPNTDVAQRWHDMKVDRAISCVQASQDSFKQAMRYLASGVSILAAGGPDDRAAITATSVTSLSVEPPTVLICISRNSSLAPVLQRYGHFSANFLSASQQHLAERFAGRNGVNGRERFEAGDWISLVSGAPVLANALASIDCDVEEILDRYTHSIIIGRVLAVRTEGGDEALTHWRGAFSPVSSES
jgi:flavin reductase (DIM6/NTAB) family NADH-FMN oxidoreductase RutF